MLILTIVSICLTWVMIVEDYKYRSIRIDCLIKLGICIISLSIVIYGVQGMLVNLFVNMMLMAFMSLGVISYLYMRYRRLINPLKNHIGAGDLIFALLLMPLLDIFSFMWMLFISFLAGLVFWIVSRNSTIPLVSMIGIVVSIYIVVMYLETV